MHSHVKQINASRDDQVDELEIVILILSFRLLRSNSTVGYSCFAAVSFLTISARPAILKSAGPIFAKFSGLVELWL